MLLVADSAMAYVAGANDFLEQSLGRAFIPQKPETSGTLGEHKGGFIVGASVDTITLGQGQSSEGSLTYDLLFDLSQYLAPGGEPIEYDPDDVQTDSMNLFLDLTDIDFVLVTGAGRTYSEALSLRLFSENKSLELTGSELGFTINETNYGVYRGGDWGLTNNTHARYTINIENHLGLQTADFARIFQDMGFVLEVTVASRTTRTAPGVGSYRNTVEYLGDYSANNDGVGDGDTPSNGLDFIIIPEPMTLSLLGLGTLGLLLQQRRR
jgi:hypothetical protein